MNAPVKLPPYSGWRPHSMRARKPGVNSANDRKAKREKLGNSQQRHIYKSAHGFKHQSYGMLCRRADELNNQKRGES